jgi:Cu(I)/Ag(I) efflux system membrane fusion protein
MYRQPLSAAVYWFFLAILAIELGACSKPANQATVANADFWTCGMHPAVHSKAPGKCPICRMDLIPVLSRDGGASLPQSHFQQSENGGAEQPLHEPKENLLQGSDVAKLGEFTVPIEQQQRIGVTYAVVSRRPTQITVRSVGNLELDQSQITECVARVDGYVEEIQVTSPGEHVKAGEPLMTVYSPDLRAPQQELINLLKVQANGNTGPAALDQIIDNARRRLRLLNVSPQEISELERVMQPNDKLLLRSPVDGIVSQAPMAAGTGVKRGDKLMTVVNLSRLWLWANINENDLPVLKVNQPVTILLPAFPERSFSGNIAVISPVIDPLNRTARIRIDIPNSDGQLKPGMHADVVAEIDAGDELTIPENAVLPTGSKMLVFVDQGAGKLEPRFIQVGRQCADRASGDQERLYQVTAGLKPGDRVVASANFLIDAEAQIQGVLRGFGEENVPDHGQ